MVVEILKNHLLQCSDTAERTATNAFLGNLREESPTTLEGWARIVPHRQFRTSDNTPGKLVIGPVDNGENRETMLDASPIFVRGNVG